MLSTILMTGCGWHKKSGTLISVNVKEPYPHKELILKNFMDVEYIPLETSDEFLCNGTVQAIGKDFIIVASMGNRFGDIFIFDRNGKGLRKFNHQGRGAGEYMWLMGITLDENNCEMFVKDIRDVLVYDLYGKFLRSFQAWGEMYNFDEEQWICKVTSSNDDVGTNFNQQFTIISKKDENIDKDIRIYFDQKVETRMIFEKGEMSYGINASYSSIIPFLDSWILTEPSSDTIFRLMSDKTVNPFMVRTPPIQSMNPVIFLFPSIFTEQYYFMETVKKEFDFDTGIGLQTTHLMYDKQEDRIFEYVALNDDFATRNTVDMSQKLFNKEVAFWQKFGADILVEAYKKGELKGKLKEVAAELEEDSNPVIMLAKYKK